MRISLIITTYNRPDALLLVLRSIETQVSKPIEVIIADDGSTNDTKEVVTSFREKSDISVIHSWQEDRGFRASKSRNKSINLCKSYTQCLFFIHCFCYYQEAEELSGQLKFLLLVQKRYFQVVYTLGYLKQESCNLHQLEILVISQLRQDVTF